MAFPKRRDRVLVHVVALVAVAQDERNPVRAHQLARRGAHDRRDGAQLARVREVSDDRRQRLGLVHDLLPNGSSGCAAGVGQHIQETTQSESLYR
jgi:hypothetical protein